MTRPLLVIAHEATRTGSPAVLLRQLAFVRGRIDAPIAVRLLASGPHEADLLATGEVDAVGVRPAAIVVNSAAAADRLFEYDASIPVMAYVHEVGDALLVLPDDARRGLVERCRRVACVSEQGRRDLVEMGVDADRIVVIPPAIAEIATPDEREVRRARASAGCDADATMVLACGEAGWRKGADLFVDVARRMTEIDPSLRFAWIGRRPRAFSRVLDHDTRAVGLSTTLSWLGEMADPMPFLAAADLLLMCSREDPQPLVPLEAALVGTPTVGFALGGMNDLADDGAALVVPYPDTRELAIVGGRVLADAHLADGLVSAGRRRVRERQSIDVVGPMFLDEVRRLLGEVDAAATNNGDGAS